MQETSFMYPKKSLKLLYKGIKNTTVEIFHRGIIIKSFYFEEEKSSITKSNVPFSTRK